MAFQFMGNSSSGVSTKNFINFFRGNNKEAYTVEEMLLHSGCQLI